ncbi:hypothetical protein B0T10DRAFT_492458 [Thelonectria olida]|uniref:Uncharacterized protein n=1 Tax=Thelonectria olida TaxID=1576542 RepID=A0A9P9APZ5_9HYPO|nr:hypothetical protein B0T10DRAFT_492458 [Thelonectria olida]
MAKLLLTSSQVQVIASGLVVLLCTFALFISGYMIQQRTLNELRVAIQPRGGVPRNTQRVTNPSPYAHAYLPEHFREKKTRLEDGTVVVQESEAQREAREQHQAIEVTETPSGGHAVQKVIPKANKDIDFKVNQDAKQENIDIVEQLKAKMKEKMQPVTPPDVVATKKSKPLSRAQRRKLIKQDLQRSAQAEDPAYYQRRMW